VPSAQHATELAPSTVPIWHVVITGFTQRLEHPSGGQYLWSAIRHARADCAEAPALLLPWNADWPGVAELIWRFRSLTRPSRVYVYAYSWGGGWGFPTLAAELAHRGIECVGVTHHYMDDQPCWWLKSLEVAAAARPAEPYGSLLEKLTTA
jgi:hypothetical protein